MSAELEVRTYGPEARERVGFFTDTSICIGCKACEVACKEWNEVPADGFDHTGFSMDNTRGLGPDSWRHVAFVEQREPPDVGEALPDSLAQHAARRKLGEDVGEMRWLMASDVCKHCTHAACLEVCPTGALFRTEFGTVVVQEDVCNGCGYCVPACPFGVLDQRKDDGRVWKCTLCYDRLKEDQEPACAKACPTDSIQFGPLGELRERAKARLEKVRGAGERGAHLYLADEEDGIGGAGAFFLLLDDAEVYGLPPDPADPVRRLGPAWRTTAIAAGALLAGVAGAFLGRSRVKDGAPMVPREKPRSYYGEPLVARPVWTPEIPAYFFIGGMAGASAPLALFSSLAGNDRLARSAAAVALAGAAVSPPLLISDLGRPERFLHMLRVLKPSSPMSVGSWVLSAFGAAAVGGAARELAGVLPRAGRAAQVAGALIGPALSTYTATLISTTSIPVWHEARHHLPFVFAAGSTATAGAASVLLTPAGAAEPARRLAVGASVAELAALKAMERRLGATGAPYRRGAPGRLARAAKAFTAGGAAAIALGRGPLAQRLGAGAVLAGGALERLAIFRAGFASADDPAYTTVPQRRRLASGEGNEQ